jgi:hypothetical protein
VQTTNTYIMNLNSAYMYKDIMEKGHIQIENKDAIKLFSATIPYSLETIRMFEYQPEELYEKNNKQYTDCIINVEFSKKYYIYEDKIDEETGNHYRKKKVQANSKKIRKKFYTEGFYIGEQHYVFYKRGAGKAKTGDALFIKADMKDCLINRSRLGLDFSQDKELDFTSLLAYESLVSSGIEMVIDIDPLTEILLIEDIYGVEFNSLANVTEEHDKELFSTTKEIKLQNCLTDGQGLLDESVFEKYEKKNKGFMLLRTDMFKCCAFNTKLSKWFAENNCTTLTDMFGNGKDASMIKLVCTPNSLKFLKFKYKFSSSEECYDYYLNNIDNKFGVVKFDKRGNYGNYNRTTYQLLNSLPYLTVDDLKSIVSDEIDYVNRLNSDNAMFLHYISSDAKASIDFEEEELETGVHKKDNIELMNALLLVNSDIQYTKKFKAMRKNLIKNYVKNLYMGKIRMRNNIYATLFSNPYEMLLASIGQYENKSIMRGREVWCSQYKNGQEFCASRNPQINAGNVMYTKNIYHNEYDWFNLTPNICVINFFDNDAPDRLQGCDTDSDTLLLLPSSVLVKHAKVCEDNFHTPINKVVGVPKPRKNTMEQLASLDEILANNYIGKIVNLSQIINSYMNDGIKKGLDKDSLNELYNASCKCSSLSQIEIDKSKKTFDNVSMFKELQKIRNIDSIKYELQFVKDKDGNFIEDKDEVKKMIVPEFFSKISTHDAYRIYEKMNTPMDELHDVLKFKKPRGGKTVEFKELLIKPSDIEKEVSNHKQLENISNVISVCGKTTVGTLMKSCNLDDEAKRIIRKTAKENAVRELEKLVITQATILDILRMALGVKDSKYSFSKYGMMSLNLMFLSNREKTLNCFKSKDMSDDEVLVRDKNGDVNIFGVKYKRTYRKNIDKQRDFQN